MTVAENQSLRERREAIVREHVAAENRQDVAATIATFDHPRYEVNGEERDGEGAVHDLLLELLSAFPDFHAEERRVRHADDAVIAEARVTGTHNGPFGGIAPTGRKIDYPLVAIFEFEEDRLVCEKVHFDTATILRQLGVLPEPGSE